LQAAAGGATSAPEHRTLRGVKRGQRMRWLGHCISYLRGHAVLTFVLMGAFFLLSGITSINLYVVLKANIDLFRKYGAQVIEDGALLQLAQILGTVFLSIFFFVLFVVCERIVVDRLTSKLRDVSAESP
jgi:hypothetical protein